MRLIEQNIDLTINDSAITCSYSKGAFSSSWQIKLLDDAITYVEDDSDISFQIAGIKEIQFEIESSAGRSLTEYQTANAYLILKDNPEPQGIFSLSVYQEAFALSSQTKSYQFCEAVLEHIKNRYSIPFTYKLSIETKEKKNAPMWIFFFFIAMVIIWILALRKH